MKKIALVFATAALLAACTGNKNQESAAPSEPESTGRVAKEIPESFEEQQIKAGMSVQLDSLTACWLRLGKSPVQINAEKKTITLTDDEKKVKPDYLINPADIMDKLESLSLKYRAMVVMDMDKTISDLYEMPDVYSEPVSKLTAEVNDPAVKYLYENGLDAEDSMKTIYAIEEENGRANYFWEAAATGIIEQLYILTKNEDKFLATFTDKDAEDITYRISILVDLYEDLSDYNLELRKLYNVLLPLEVLNAITVDELRGQLDQIKAQVEQARTTLFL